MQITWDTDCNAPCAGRIVADDGRDILIQTDWDYPGVANVFGWSINNVQKCPICCKICELEDGLFQCPDQCDCDVTDGPCNHDGTDGTIDCKYCGCTASDFITAASEWLSDNDGATVNDTGYFGD